MGNKADIKYSRELDLKEKFNLFWNQALKTNGEDYLKRLKLHFIWDGDWWDTYIAEECDGFSETFEEHDIMLDCVEYDGRIYHRTVWEFVPGLKYYGGTVLVHPDLQVAEL